LKGIDISPDMLKVAQGKCKRAQLSIGDMTQPLQDQDLAGILNCFSIHHLNPGQPQEAIIQWAQALKPSGCLYLAAWEGEGNIDYGSHDMTAYFWPEKTLEQWLTDAGLNIIMKRTHFEKEMEMNSIYFIAQRT